MGKGITFDTGGLQIKPRTGMPGMKTDMGGAAAMLAAFQALVTLRPANVELHLAGRHEPNSVDLTPRGF